MPYSERPHTTETKKEKPKPEDREFFNLAKSTESPVFGPAIRNLSISVNEYCLANRRPFVKLKNK